MTVYKLKARCGDLRFKLDTEPTSYPEGGPVVQVFDVENGKPWHVASYCLETLDGTDGFDEDQDGWCGTSGRYEKYRTVPARTHAAIVRQSHKIVDKTTA